MKDINTHIILVTCSDDVGIIANLSTVMADNGLNIIVMREFVEEESKRFFARLEVAGELNVPKLASELEKVLPPDSDININPKAKKDIVVLATKEHHCLGDLLIKNHFGDINAHIKCVIANHDTLAPLVQRFGIPFVYISHEDKTKQAFEEEILEVISHYSPDYLVLSKFMRILSKDFVAHFENKIINIHHSFLPAFIGANPYKKAYERGVKMIGATAHIVSNDLDEGPIITQETTMVNHTFSKQDMVLAGREIEKKVLSSALKMVFEDRVFVSGNKTIILE